MMTLILALMLLAPETPKWSDGHLISITSETHSHTGGVFQPSGQGVIGTRRDTVYTLRLSITMDSAPMIVDGSYEPRRSQPPNVIENDAIKYRIVGHDLFILDRDSKELKLRVMKMRKP